MSSAQKSDWMVVGFVPTIYQRGSLMTLMGVAEQQGNGSYYAAHYFNSQDEAKEWLYQRLYWLYDIGILNDKEYYEQVEYLDAGGQAISYDAAFCRIEESPHQPHYEEDGEDGD